MTLLAWGGGAWAGSWARGVLNKRLADHGLALTCSAETWSPWNGVTLQKAELRRTAAGAAPVAAISALHVDLEWAASWKTGAAVTHWRARDATLTLHDEEGAVTLQHFTASLTVNNGKAALERLGMRDGPVTYDLTGEVLTGSENAAATQGGPQLRLKALRGMLNTLHFTGPGEFKVTGSFRVDARQRPWMWNASLHGEGRQVAWHSVPLEAAVSEAKLSAAGMKVASSLQFSRGSGRVEITREGWKHTPLRLQGSLTDTAGRQDEFKGSYQAAERRLEVEELSGKADLFELLGNVPALAGRLPQAIKIKTFPEIAARDLVCIWHAPGKPPSWSLARAQLRSPADFVVSVHEQPLSINDMTGSLGFEDGTWLFHDVRGGLLGGSFGLEGRYDGRALRKADISLRSLRLSRLSPWVGKVNGKLDDSELTMSYRGSICGREPELSTGGGTVVLTNAPVVHIPVLDQAYALFPKLLPRKGSDGTGEFQMSFVMTKGVAAVDPFKARSESVTVTATGTVDLVRRRVDGQARANLRGVAGVVTAPLSHVLTDMEIQGPLSDIRIAPQGPLGAAKKTVKAAAGGVKFSSEVVGTGLTLPFRALGLLDD